MLHDLFQNNSLVCRATALLYEEKLLVDISLDLHHQFADKVSIADQSSMLGLNLFELLLLLVNLLFELINHCLYLLMCVLANLSCFEACQAI